MPFSVGIGIVTYNRKAILSDTIDRVRAYTSHPGAAIVVADDGSSDGTGAMLRERRVPVITGVQYGNCLEQEPGAIFACADAGMRNGHPAGR